MGTICVTAVRGAVGWMTSPGCVEREELWAVDGTVVNTTIKGTFGGRQKRSQRSRRQQGDAAIMKGRGKETQRYQPTQLSATERAAEVKVTVCRRGQGVPRG